MPTIVSTADRKLAFRRRIRLNKVEEKAVAEFCKLVEERAKAGRISEAKELKGSQTVAALGIKYLGSGCFKSAFSLPGDRYVIKVPNCLHRMADNPERFQRFVAKNITPETLTYTGATPENREILAAVRLADCGWATLQERAETTVDKFLEKESDDERRSTVRRNQEAVRSRGLAMGLEDLHGQNLAVRKDLSVCIIDYCAPAFGV